MVLVTMFWMLATWKLGRGFNTWVVYCPLSLSTYRKSVSSSMVVFGTTENPPSNFRLPHVYLGDVHCTLLGIREIFYIVAYYFLVSDGYYFVDISLSYSSLQNIVVGNHY